MLTFKVKLVHRRNHNILYTTITVQPPAGWGAAKQMAEAMYGSEFEVYVLG
jgi:hypothetical protein